MMESSQRIKTSVFRMGPAARLGRALLAVALFAVLLIVGALVASGAVATFVVIRVKLWWLHRRRGTGQTTRSRGGRILEADYEIAPPQRAPNDMD